MLQSRADGASLCCSAENQGPRPSQGSENAAWLSSPVGLADHQGRHLLRRGAVVSETNATAAAGIPTEGEELGLQKESVFFQLAEHRCIRAFPAESHGPSPSPYRPIRGGTLAEKTKSSPFGTALVVCAVSGGEKSALLADGNSASGQIGLHFRDGVRAEVGDGSDQNRIGMGGGDGVVEVLERAGAAGGDDR